MKLTIKSTVEPAQTAKMLQASKRLWIFAASEWWRLISPYTPYDTGNLMSKVTIAPKTITYLSPYAKTVYESVDRKFRKDPHRLATAKWDEVARPTQERKLIQALQAYIEKVNING